MAEQLKGIRFVDGTKADFDVNTIEEDVLAFVRTSEDKDSGYAYFNGKKYGNSINAGEYPDNTKA